jgi:hypothetical protein
MNHTETSLLILQVKVNGERTPTARKVNAEIPPEATQPVKSCAGHVLGGSTTLIAVRQKLCSRLPEIQAGDVKLMSVGSGKLRQSLPKTAIEVLPRP